MAALHKIPDALDSKVRRHSIPEDVGLEVYFCESSLEMTGRIAVALAKKRDRSP